MMTNMRSHVDRKAGGLERLFALRADRSNIRSEVLGGLTTFITMACIVVVNPAIGIAGHR
jgi:AGZA family xanthine/uracil permease-like MFS transporter